MNEVSPKKIIDGIRAFAVSQIMRIIIRTPRKTQQEIVKMACPVESQSHLYDTFVRELHARGDLDFSDEGYVIATSKGKERFSRIPDETPRPYTQEESEKMLIEHMIRTAWYWHRLEGKSEWEKMTGLLFSLLVTLDGGSANLPAFDLVASPHEEDARYHADHGENWFDDSTVINGCASHERFYAILEDMSDELQERPS